MLYLVKTDFDTNRRQEGFFLSPVSFRGIYEKNIRCIYRIYFINDDDLLINALLRRQKGT